MDLGSGSGVCSFPGVAIFATGYIAEVNKLINPDMEYVYFRAVNVAVSSSMVKELHSFGLDVSPYLPGPVYDML